MNVIKWLEKVRVMDEQIDKMLAERDRLMFIATDASAKEITDMPIDHGGTVAQKMQDAVCAIVDLDKKIDRLTDKYVDHKQQVINALRCLPDFEHRILYEHYIKYHTWVDIAVHESYSTVHLWRIRKGAYYMLERHLECNANL